MPDAQLPAAGPRDRFVPIRKADLIDALIEDGAFADDAEQGKFRLLCEMLAAIYHYEYFATLERMRHDYYYFNPEIAPHAAVDPALLEQSYTDLVQSLDGVLRDANFSELPHAEVGDAHRRRTVLRVDVTAEMTDFREVRFYRRGRHIETFMVPTLFGLRRRKIEAEVYDDVVLLAALKSEAGIGSDRELRALERRKIRPGSVLLKCFRNIASTDLNALFPNARVVMSNIDKLVLGVPAIAGGIPILINIYTTITVLFLVLGFYIGVSASVEDKDMKTALAALSGLVALGGFVLRQWVKYQRQSLKYQIELTDNIYYRNVNNNAGIFDYVIGAAEEQESKRALLCYHFLRHAPQSATADDLAGRIDAWIHTRFGVAVDFAVRDALEKLQQLGLIRRDGEQISVSALDEALAALRRIWNDFFAGKKAAPSPITRRDTQP